ncbi:hypothetical protein QBC45DRAFT_1146 [Copromyces sp. CBS 386.78]|nr:hypothetical protein QBC45DRAFT_1146 [Copromyces sp. CBS 386.78]
MVEKDCLPLARAFRLFYPVGNKIAAISVRRISNQFSAGRQPASVAGRHCLNGFGARLAWAQNRYSSYSTPGHAGRDTTPRAPSDRKNLPEPHQAYLATTYSFSNMLSVDNGYH